MKRLPTPYPLLMMMLAACLTPTLGAAATCETAQCHASIRQGPVAHPVAESCDTCHQPVLAPHPQKKKKTFALLQEQRALCAQCHQAFGSAPVVHKPVKDGACTGCHDPHGAKEPKLLRRPVHELCITCHGALTANKYVHGPAAAGDCTSCHAPHESKHRALTLKDGGDLCFGCHADLPETLKKKYVHTALSGGCTSCHNPHSSKNKRLLAAAGDALCFQCHPAIEEKTAKAAVVHAPLRSEKGCASCHAPHASDGAKLLPASGKDLCVGCHATVIRKEHAVLHGPIKEGRCTPCHDPHASAFPRLLVRSYSDLFYVPYTDKEYDLCFSCHKRDLLRYPTTSYATAFRDGDRNLHYLHVNIKDKGRSCRSCHAVHGGALPKLIVDKAPFGKWSLPLRFIKTESGGSCAPGCHQKAVYDRKTPGKPGAPERDDAPKRKPGV